MLACERIGGGGGDLIIFARGEGKGGEMDR